VPEKRPLTIPEIMARRRNARQSTGPRSKEGRYRVSLNRRHMKLRPLAIRNLKRLDADPGDVQRVWRDVMTVFKFMGRHMEPYFNAIAWDLWLKQYCLLRSYPRYQLDGIDARLERNLGDLLCVYKLTNRKWKHLLRREFGAFAEGQARHWRMAIELRLGSNQRLASAGRFPPESESVLADAVGDLADLFADFGESLMAEHEAWDQSESA
jgi:hypothetical protein